MFKRNPKVRRGVYAREIVTGLEGYITDELYLMNGQHQFCITPKGDGKTVLEGRYFDPHSIEVLPEPKAFTFEEAELTEIALGEKVRDKITGFVGTATQKVIYQNGCVSFGVTPTVDSKGKVPDTVYISHERLERLSVSEKKSEPNRTGCAPTRPSLMRQI